jgi:hypothetical protein
MTTVNRYLLWPLLLTSHLLATSLFAWHLLAQINFAYPLGYQILAIDEHIQEYGPLNRYKSDFAQTIPAEHKHLFGEITRAVQNHGEGLAHISYRLPDGKFTPLMREAEVIHLQDVANLIDMFYIAGLIGTGVWVLLLAYAYAARCPFPDVKKILLGFVAALVVLTITTLVIGAETVFYWLHEQIFPDEHEWFFFYQDSLMTTLMHAPQLFGLISVLLVALLILLWAFSMWGMAHGLNVRVAAATASLETAKSITETQTRAKNKIKKNKR